MKDVIIPTGGLANRVRVILSALQWQHDTGRRVRLFWIQDNGLACPFEEIFEPLVEIVDAGRWRWQEYRLLKKLTTFGFLRRFMIFTESEYDKLHEWAIVPSRKTLFCASFSRFYSGATPQYKDVFLLKENLRTRVTQAISGFDEHTIGIHIRRTDNFDSIVGSPLELFEAKIRDEIKQDSDVKFYLATDDVEVQQWLKNLFGERIIIHPGPLVRNSKEGIVHAVVELYTLASCSKILGSYYSSYSELAAEIGNIELIVVGK